VISGLFLREYKRRQPAVPAQGILWVAKRSDGWSATGAVPGWYVACTMLYQLGDYLMKFAGKRHYSARDLFPLCALARTTSRTAPRLSLNIRTVCSLDYPSEYYPIGFRTSTKRLVLNVAAIYGLRVKRFVSTKERHVTKCGRGKFLSFFGSVTGLPAALRLHVYTHAL
jgi:hypothetical protein